jgi:glycosyltransferase involved in cell wall biosynthesis
LLKVLFVSTHSGFYGSNQSLLQLCNALSARIDITVLVQRKNIFWKILRKHNISTLVFPCYKIVMRNNKGFIFKKIINFLLKPFLIAYLYRYKFDFIITNSANTYLYAQAAKKLDIRHIWHIRENLNEHTTMLFDGGFESYKKRLIELSVARIYSSNALKESYGIDNGQNASKVIYDGVVKKSDKNYRSLQKRIKSPVFLFIGTIAFEKGVVYACNIAKEIMIKYPNAKLKLVGNYAPGVSEFITNKFSIFFYNNSFVHIPFTNDTLKEYCGADFLFSFSNFEGFGRNVAEAMVRKLLVCTFDKGAVPELIGSDYNGVIGKYGETDVIINKIINYIENQPSYNSAVISAHSRAKQFFTIEKCSDEYLYFLLSI